VPFLETAESTDAAAGLAAENDCKFRVDPWQLAGFLRRSKCERAGRGDIRGRTRSPSRGKQGPGAFKPETQGPPRPRRNRLWRRTFTARRSSPRAAALG